MVQKQKVKRKTYHVNMKVIWKHRWIYLMLVPVLAYYIIFKYVPMYGIVMSFQDYNVFQGVFGSEWVGFEVFNRIFHNPNFGQQ